MGILPTLPFRVSSAQPHVLKLLPCSLYYAVDFEVLSLQIQSYRAESFIMKLKSLKKGSACHTISLRLERGPLYPTNESERRLYFKGLSCAIHGSSGHDYSASRRRRVSAIFIWPLLDPGTVSIPGEIERN